MKKFWIWFLPGVLAGIIIIGAGSVAVNKTSTDEYCNSCHEIHPHSTTSWKQSVHYVTKSGTHTGCVACHLPPHGEGYLMAKAVTGARDLWGKWTKDPESFDWEEKGSIEHARKHVYEASCLACHENLFPHELTKEGEDAHLYYTSASRPADLHCINCHLNAGHYIEGYVHGSVTGFGSAISGSLINFTGPAAVSAFQTFTEQITGSSVSFNMVAIPSGTFSMGSPDNEPLRNTDEGPVRQVKVDSFYMAEVEVTWDAYLAFYAQTSAEGRSTDTEGSRLLKNQKTDAITGATPPYGQPDQGWGKGKRPAISITYHAAETYCRWLSQVTGKKYRLPTEAEWEYAYRAGTATPYFFEGKPDRFDKKGIRAKLSKNDTAFINTYVVYHENSPGKTQEPAFVDANPFGLKNMGGNVAEFCSDWYQPDAYQQYPSGILNNPAGPASGVERVIRGGSFRDPAGKIRSAARDYTRTVSWLRTDPQMPKSIWWYSDCFHVGFRVVCEFDEKTGKGASGNQ
ncbi:MAG TPA: SUMF1/EgtB/PvdO family nonheme iron enzyme [Bacteroidales bacterium]|nr:SUMF1/EgtB/PvdO family nonheme iron enzyme [Bacteroidales bacterium]